MHSSDSLIPGFGVRVALFEVNFNKQYAAPNDWIWR